MPSVAPSHPGTTTPIICISLPGLFLSGLPTPFGQCPPGTIRITTTDQLHVWTAPNPNGPFGDSIRRGLGSSHSRDRPAPPAAPDQSAAGALVAAGTLVLALATHGPAAMAVRLVTGASAVVPLLIATGLLAGWRRIRPLGIIYEALLLGSGAVDTVVLQNSDLVAILVNTLLRRRSSTSCFGVKRQWSRGQVRYRWVDR